MGSLFQVERTSNDDLFLLLAAFDSGDNCKILTNDYMRQHCHIIFQEPVQLSKTFIQWQASHQIRVDEFRGFRRVRSADEVDHCDPKFVWPQPRFNIVTEPPITGTYLSYL